MKKLPKSVFEYVMVRDIDSDDMDRFDAWVKRQTPETLKHYYHWTLNQQLLIPYHIYEMWVRFEDDMALLTTLQGLPGFGR